MGLTDQLKKGAGGVLRGGAGAADIATGTVKSVAGGVLGKSGLKRQGAEEQRKGEAKDELAAQQAKVAEEEKRAEQLAAEERDRAAKKAQEEFARAERAIERKQETVKAEKEKVASKTQAVSALEDATDPDKLVAANTRAQLDEKAKQLGVTGRGRMSKQDLAEAIVAKR